MKNHDRPSAEHALIKLPQVEHLTGLKKSEIYRRIQIGQFPKPVKLGERASAWVLSEVSSWVGERIASRDEGRAA